MEKNILQVWIDRAGRITESLNLSLNQCSDNNEFRVYYTDEVFTNLEISFRKPDGWVSDKFSMIHTLEVDEEGISTGQKYAHMDIPEEITNFILAGRNGIITANLYMYTKNTDGNTKLNTLGNIRINVNYVDDANVHTGFSQMYIDSVNARITDLHNQIINVQEGNTIVSRAISDRFGNTIDTTYETKHDAEVKFDTLDDRKLDRVELTDQTNRLTALENTSKLTGDRVSDIEKDIDLNEENISKNTQDISNLNTTTVKYDEYNAHLISQQKKDEDLQKQIDDIASSSNIKDMVSTYSELQKYDKSKLEDGDRIQVLADVNYENSPTIWRYNAETNSFDFIGKYASVSYTRAEIDTQHNEIKATIPNKIVNSNNTISLYKDGTQITGQTPVQFKTINGQTIFGSGDIPATIVDDKFSSTSKNPVQNKVITNELSSKANKAEVNELKNTKADKTELDAKQNKLTPVGSNIKITDDGKISVDIGLKIERVDSLPQVGLSNLIYLVPNNEGSFNEYIWVLSENKFELLGNTAINLDNYYTKNDTDTLLLNKVDVSVIESLDKRITSNTANVSSKADKTVVDTLTNNVSAITTALDTKANNSDLEKYKTEVQTEFSTRQEKLVSGENIKRVQDGAVPYEVNEDTGEITYGTRSITDVLGYGEINIKTINGKSLFGEGNLLLADAKFVDLGKYLEKEQYEQDIVLKADKTELFDKDYNSLKNKPDLDALQTQILAQNKNDLTSVSNLLTDKIDTLEGNVYKKTETLSTEEIEQKIADVDISGKLENYYTKEEVDTAIQEHVPELAGYATETWVEDKNYLTKLEAASKYALVENIPTDVASRAYVDSAVAAVDVSSQLTEYAKTEYVDKKVSDLINSAPETLDTLSEIATALENNSDTIDILNEAIGTKQDKLVAGSNIEIVGNTISAVIDINADDIPGLNLSDYAKKTYVDNTITAKVAEVVGAAPKELDTLYEISAAIKDNKGTIEELETLATSKQDKLVSGTNIKTINSQSILGSGNIKVAGSFNDLTDKDNVIVSAVVSDNTLTLRNAGNNTVVFKGTTDYTKLTNTPTKLSQFTNDKKYATTDEVSTTVSTELAKVIAGADASYDTLKEISDYIASDKMNAATLTATVDANKLNIQMLKEDLPKLEDRVEVNETDIAEIKEFNNNVNESFIDLSTNVNTNTTNISTLTTKVENLEAIDHDSMLSDISDLKSTTTVHTGNISDINSRIDTINTKNNEQDTTLAEIQQTIGNFNGSLSDFYTKTESDDRFLTYQETITKSEGVVDYANNNKIIRFTTDVATPDFTITETEFTDISNLLTMMVPNEY